MCIVRELTEKIAQVDAYIMKNDIVIENMKREVFSVEQYYRMLDAMIQNLELETDENLRDLMHAFVEKIELYPEKTKSGRWIKSVQFKVALNVDGKLCDVVEFDDEDSLPNPTKRTMKRLLFKMKILSRNKAAYLSRI